MTDDLLFHTNSSVWPIVPNFEYPYQHSFEAFRIRILDLGTIEFNLEQQFVD